LLRGTTSIQLKFELLSVTGNHQPAL